jgi:hypothetical protein
MNVPLARTYRANGTFMRLHCRAGHLSDPVSTPAFHLEVTTVVAAVPTVTEGQTTEQPRMNIALIRSRPESTAPHPKGAQMLMEV